MVVVIKGAGEMASGVAHRLHRSGIRRIVMTDIDDSLCVRRMVSFSEALFEGQMVVEGVAAERIDDLSQVEEVWSRGAIAVIVDPQWQCVRELKPDVVIDAIMAKRNLGTKKDEASLVVGIGPGFAAPEDVHIVVESNRGHDLGRVILEGAAEAYTGVPGQIGGFTAERVLRAPVDGLVKHVKKLGGPVKKDEPVLSVDGTMVFAPMDGVLRGLIREIKVIKGEKVGDVDPRGKQEHCRTISEKARAIGGGVLEAVMLAFNR